MRTDLPNDKKTKAELLEIVEEQVHLASAVNAKDQEILLLKEEMKAIKTKAKDEVEAIKTQAQEEHDKLVVNFEQQKNQSYLELKAQYEGEVKTLKDAAASLNLKLQELQQLRVNDLNKLIMVHGDLLKTLQGVVDTHLNLNDLVVEKLGGN